MKKLLTHSKTKGELTTFLAKNVNVKLIGDKSLWRGERNVRQRTETSDIYNNNNNNNNNNLLVV